MKSRILAVILALAASSSRAAVPGAVTWQGRLAGSDGTPVTGSVDLTVRYLAGAADPAALYYSEKFTGVAVAAGHFALALGSGTATPGTEPTFADVFRANSDVWLDVAVNTDAPMTPRIKLLSVPYALNAPTAPAAPTAFVHKATAANISGGATTIDNPLCNGDAGAILIVTQNLTPGGTAATKYVSHTGVSYNGSRWQIVGTASNTVPMPAGAAFNVLVLKP